MKHPVFISVLLSHMIREYSIPFLRTFSRGIDPFWLASHVRLYNMSEYIECCLLFLSPVFLCFPCICIPIYSCVFFFLPVFLRFCHIFSSGLFFACFPVSPCIPVCFYVFPCIPMFSPACFPIYPPVFLCFALYPPFFMSAYFSLVFLFFLVFLGFPMFPPVFLCTLVFLCFAMFSNALPCFPMFSSASPFIPMFSNVFPCFLMFSPAFLYFPLHPPFFLCFQMFSPVFLCFIPLFSYVHVSQITTQVVETSITSNTNSPHFHPDDHTQPYVHHVTMLWLKNGIKYCCS